MFLGLQILGRPTTLVAAPSIEVNKRQGMVKIKQSVKQGQQGYFKNLNFDAYSFSIG
jgi:hypothetical protein